MKREQRGETGSACVRIQTSAFSSLFSSLPHLSGDAVLCKALLCSIGNFEIEGTELTSFTAGRQCYKKQILFKIARQLPVLQSKISAVAP